MKAEDMMTREQLIQRVSRLMSRLTDLNDMLQDGVPVSVGDQIRAEMDNVNDMIVHHQEWIESFPRPS